ncbi:MAG: hypothetical protein ACK56I_04485 [bacterium]
MKSLDFCVPVERLGLERALIQRGELFSLQKLLAGDPDVCHLTAVCAVD